MYDRRISVVDATALDVEADLAAALSLTEELRDLANASRNFAASHHDSFAAAPDSLAARYAAANSITRRRFDALLREGETTARMGFNLLAGRVGHGGSGTAAAARFLGRTMAATLYKLEKLLGPHAA